MKRILIAEDDNISRRVLETTLGQWGYDVVSTVNGKDTWEALQENDPPSILVLDWMMPELDGLELCKRIRSDTRLARSHIILLTALGHTEEIVAGLEAGANDYVTKPFKREELHARLRAGIRVLDLESQLEERVAELEEALAHVKTLQGSISVQVWSLFRIFLQ